MFTLEGITLLALLNVVAVDLVLSGDNALVIGMAVRQLPPAVAKRAAIAGAALAVGLRVAFTGLAAMLMAIPLLQAAGGALLLHLAAKLASGQEDGAEQTAGGTGFWAAVKAIVVADVVMSLDNVLAVGGAAHGNLALMALGLALSIPLVLGGSALVTKALQRWPILNLAGAAVLAATAGQMIGHDAVVASYLGDWGLAAPALAAAAVAGRAIFRTRTAAQEA